MNSKTKLSSFWFLGAFTGSLASLLSTVIFLGGFSGYELVVAVGGFLLGGLAGFIGGKLGEKPAVIVLAVIFGSALSFCSVTTLLVLYPLD